MEQYIITLFAFLFIHRNYFSVRSYISLNEQMVMFQLKCFQESFHVKQKLPGEREAGEIIKPENYNNCILHSHKKSFSLFFFLLLFYCASLLSFIFFIKSFERFVCFFHVRFLLCLWGFLWFWFGLFCCLLLGLFGFWFCFLFFFSWKKPNPKSINLVLFGMKIGF